MKLVVGLGNPGPRYAASRHNVGFRVVGALARARRIELRQDRSLGRFLGRYAEGILSPDPKASESSGAPPERVGLLEPTTFMNRSGESIASALAELPEVDPARDLLVISDDLDLPLGRLRLRPRGGAGGHNGMASVIECLGSGEFARLRFGIGRPSASGPEGRAEIVDFVLDAFSPAEEIAVTERVALAADAALAFLLEGVRVAMDRFNGASELEAEP